MRAGLLSVPIMRPNRCWTALHVSILAGLLLTLNAESEDSGCFTDLQVPHSTVYEALLGEELQISCTVVFCNSPPPTVSWYKREQTDIPVNVSTNSHIKTHWELLGQLKGRSLLIFEKTLRKDSGLYHCGVGFTVSHNIQVTVHDGGVHTNVTLENGTRSTTLVPEPTTEDLWMYMCITAGTVAFVVTVIIISVVSMRACKGKSKEETQTDVQYVAIPMAEQPFPRSSLQASPRGRPSTPPSWRSTRRKRPPSQPDELPLPSNSEQVYSRERREKTVQEKERCVVYAALNHQLPAGRTAQKRPKEEPSEYAALRFKDPSLN